MAHRFVVLGTVTLSAMLLPGPIAGATTRLTEAATPSQPMSRTPIGEFNSLHDAVRRNDTGRVQQLLANRTDVNAKDSLGRAPLSYASRLGEFTIVQLLLNAGAEIDVQDNDAFTPLMRAVQGGHPVIVELLLRHGADGTAKTNDGTTALELAMQSSNPQIVELLRRYLK
jgi:uncharacterized protein